MPRLLGSTSVSPQEQEKVRSAVLSVASFVGGLVVAVILVLGSYFAGFAPIEILSAGSVENVPGWVNTSSRYSNDPFICTSQPCGYAGEIKFDFSVVRSVSLSGVLRASEPIWLAVTTQPGNNLCGHFSYPPPPCAAVAGPSFLYIVSTAQTTFNFDSLQFNFSGANNEVPSGSWSVVFANENLSPAEVTVTSSLIATPT